MLFWQHVLVLFFMTVFMPRDKFACTGYTQDFREIETQFATTTDDIIYWRYDLMRNTMEEALSRLCQHYHCEQSIKTLRSETHRSLAMQIQDFYAPTNFSSLKSFIDTDILPDIKKIEAAIETIIHNFTDMVLNRCSAHTLGSQCAIDNALADIATETTVYFNSERYEEALALSFSMLNFIESNAILVDASVVLGVMLQRLYSIFAESSLISGNLEASTWAYTMVSRVLKYL